MAWNKPGGGNGQGPHDPQDPWSGNHGNRGNQGPPDLDEALRKFQSMLNGLFGGGRGGNDAGDAKQGGSGGLGIGLGLVLAVILGLWLFTGFYQVEQGEEGVVLRFGQHVDTTTAGLRWHIPAPFESVEIVNVKEVRSVDHQALMLTGDENIVVIKLEIQYLVKDSGQFLFNVNQPERALKEASEAAMREVVGRTLMDTVLTSGRAAIVDDVRKLTQQMMEDYRTGLDVLTVNLEDAQAPEEVQDAFADAIKAREDKDRFVKQAEAYANSILPKAKGRAERLRKEADAYRAQVVARAEGEADRFNLVLGEYRQAPEVTRERLYIEAMESILAESSKVMLDTEGGNNLVYLPLDRILDRRSGTEVGKDLGNQAAGLAEGLNQAAPPQRAVGRTLDRVVNRGREMRR